MLEKLRLNASSIILSLYLSYGDHSICGHSCSTLMFFHPFHHGFLPQSRLFWISAFLCPHHLLYFHQILHFCHPFCFLLSEILRIKESFKGDSFKISVDNNKKYVWFVPDNFQKPKDIDIPDMKKVEPF